VQLHFLYPSIYTYDDRKRMENNKIFVKKKNLLSTRIAAFRDLISQQKASRLLQMLLFCLFVCQQKPS